MEILNLRQRKIKVRRIAVRAERLNGTRDHSKIAGLSFIPGETVPRKEHPRRAQDFVSYKRLKASSINQPGPGTEADQIRMLRFETQSEDAQLFQEALAGESWRGRGR